MPSSGGVTDPAEHLHGLGHAVGVHADAGVSDRNDNATAGLACHRKNDITAHGGEFHSVGKHVDQDLFDPPVVAIKALSALGHLVGKDDATLQSPGFHDVEHEIGHLGHFDFFFRQFDLARLHRRQIHNVVDQLQKMTPGRIDGRQVLFFPFVGD